jgi:hypothetical protein
MLEQFQQFEIQNSDKIRGGHTNGSDGIPPDGEIRTNRGLYPTEV